MKPRSQTAPQSDEYYRPIVEVLENRFMLSGNIVAEIFGNDLHLWGDNQDNDAEVVVDDNQVLVRGLNGTTINGQETFVAFNGNVTPTQIPGSVFAFLKDGADELTFKDNLQISGSAFIYSGRGNDQIGFSQSSINGNLFLHTQDGDDEIIFNNVDIGWNSFLFTGYGDDLISARDLRVQHSVFAYAGMGNDDAVFERANIGGQLFVHQESGDDDLVIDDSTIGWNLFVFGNSGNDVNSITDTTVNRYFFSFDGLGDDTTDLGTGNHFGKRVYAFGSLGTDSFAVNSDNVFDKGRMTFGIDQNTVDTSLLDQRITNGALARSNTAQGIFDPVNHSLTVTTDNNNTINSSNALITQNSNFQIDGTTSPNATVQIDVDGDSVFDETTQADASGNFSVTVGLTSSSTTGELQRVEVRSTATDNQSLSEFFNTYVAMGTVVRMNTSLGAVDLELFDQDAPATVANFLNYIESRYDNSIFHRSINVANDGLDVIQGGGFVSAPGKAVQAITTDPAVTNEFNADNSNVRGTIAMAQPPGNINGATSQWFFNVSNANAASLDSQRFVVFGRVIGSGMQVIDQIHQLSTRNVSGQVSQPALTDVPVQNPATVGTQLTGTVSIPLDLNELNGQDTRFLTELQVDMKLIIEGRVYTVERVISDVLADLKEASEVAISGQTATIAPDFVFVNSVSELLSFSNP